MTLSGVAKLFAGYVVTGGTAAIVDLGGFALLNHAGAPVPTAAALSFLAAALVNYVTTSRFVYRRPLSGGRLTMFLAVALVGFAINVGVTTAMAHVFAIPALLAKLFGIATAFGVNFALNTVVVFRQRA